MPKALRKPMAISLERKQDFTGYPTFYVHGWPVPEMQEQFPARESDHVSWQAEIGASLQ